MIIFFSIVNQGNGNANKASHRLHKIYVAKNPQFSSLDDPKDTLGVQMKVVTDGIPSSFSALVLVGWIVGVAAGIRRSFCLELLGSAARRQQRCLRVVFKVSFSDLGLPQKLNATAVRVQQHHRTLLPHFCGISQTWYGNQYNKYFYIFQ